MNLRQRTDAFWAWFEENELELSEYFTNKEKPKLDHWVEFVSKGLGLISENAMFNMGGEYEFTLTVAGSLYRFYLNSYIVSRAPAHLREKWQIFPYSQPAKSKDITFYMNGVSISELSVQVAMEQNPQSGNFRLRFYQPDLAPLKEDAYSVFFNMMGLCIGDALDLLYIEHVTMLEEPEEGMFGLADLAKKMSEQVLASGKVLYTRPDERYVAYWREPDPNGGLRQDIISGNTSYTALTNEYYAGETTTKDQLESYGASPQFLAFGYSQQEDRNHLLALRYEIENALENHVLGKRGTGNELGLLLGGAMGTGFVYIDLLLYDTETFLKKIKGFLAGQPYKFYLSDFAPESPLVPLFEE